MITPQSPLNPNCGKRKSVENAPWFFLYLKRNDLYAFCLYSFGEVGTSYVVAPRLKGPRKYVFPAKADVFQGPLGMLWKEMLNEYPTATVTCQRSHLTYQVKGELQECVAQKSGLVSWWKYNCQYIFTKNDNRSLTRTEFQGTPALVAWGGLYSNETWKSGQERGRKKIKRWWCHKNCESFFKNIFWNVH